MTTASSVRTEKNRLSNPDPFLWLIQVRVPASPASAIRVTPNPTPITFGMSTAGTPLEWTPYPIEFDEITSDSEGSLPELTVSISNVNREVMALMLQYDFLLDQPAVFRLVHGSMLGDTTTAEEFRFTISGFEADERAITWHVGLANLYNFPIPGGRILRDTCGHTYRDEDCGFTGDPDNATLGACKRTREECGRREAYEIANGLPVIHPGRWGAFPGVARQ